MKESYNDALEMQLSSLAARFPNVLFAKPTDLTITLHNIYNFQHLPNAWMWKYQPEYL